MDSALTMRICIPGHHFQYLTNFQDKKAETFFLLNPFLKIINDENDTQNIAKGAIIAQSIK
jgi:hypothetical protein